MILRGRLIDGTGRFTPEAAVEVRGDKIARVEWEKGILSSGPGLNLKGMTILPGLIDAHLHLWGVRTMDYFRRIHIPEEVNLLRATQDLNRLIDAGYTSIRDTGSKMALFLRNAVDEGTLRGPRIKTPRLVINQTGGHLDRHYLPLEEIKALKWQTVCRIADGVDECRRAVREQFREGADYIKICVTGGLTGQKEAVEEVQFSEEEVRAIVEEAGKKSKKVAAHAQGLKGTKKAVQWGVQLIEHGVFLDEEVCGEMIRRKVILTPTLTISYKYATEGEKHGAMPWAVERAKKVLDAHLKSFQLARRLGVKYAAGTDFSGPPMVPYGKNAIELELMVKAGCSPMEAIVAATRTASEVMGTDAETGTVEPGKLADLIVVEGDPLEDIRILQDESRIKWVMKGGQVLKSNLPAEGLP